MKYPVEPCVVRRGGTAEWLADVLILSRDEPALFDEYPGLSVVVIVHNGLTAEVRYRDGTASSLRLEPGIPVRLLAVAAYHNWVARSSSAREEPSSS